MSEIWTAVYLFVLSPLVQGRGLTLTVAVLIGIVLDFATGIAKGYKADHKVSSSKLRDGGFKKAGIVLVIFLAYGLSVLFGDTSHLIFNSVQLYYLYTELVSIIENLVALGVDAPPWLRKLLGEKKNEVDQLGGDNDGKTAI